jgi:hypothetical protein
MAMTLAEPAAVGGVNLPVFNYHISVEMGMESCTHGACPRGDLSLAPHMSFLCREGRVHSPALTATCTSGECHVQAAWSLELMLQERDVLTGILCLPMQG